MTRTADAASEPPGIAIDEGAPRVSPLAYCLEHRGARSEPRPAKAADGEVRVGHRGQGRACGRRRLDALRPGADGRRPVHRHAARLAWPPARWISTCRRRSARASVTSVSRSPAHPGRRQEQDKDPGHGRRLLARCDRRRHAQDEDGAQGRHRRHRDVRRRRSYLTLDGRVTAPGQTVRSQPRRPHHRLQGRGPKRTRTRARRARSPSS